MLRVGELNGKVARYSEYNEFGDSVGPGMVQKILFSMDSGRFFFASMLGIAN